MNDTINVTKLNDLIIIKKEGDNAFFLSSSNSFIISISNLSSLLKFMVFRGLLSKKVLEGIVNEYDNRYK